MGILIAQFVGDRLPNSRLGEANRNRRPALALRGSGIHAGPARSPRGNRTTGVPDKSIVASAVRTPEDAQTLAVCAYEFVQGAGFEEARRAFNEDVRWKSGPIYVFVSEVTPLSDQARLFVFPPDQAREGTSLGLLIDAFGNDYYKEQHRIASEFGEGWIYYSFSNPADWAGRTEGHLHQEHRLERKHCRNRRGGLPPRLAWHLPER